jgi:hypothetical protein
LGNSQAGRYYDAMVEVVENASGKDCRLLKTERINKTLKSSRLVHFTIDRSYFLTGDQNIDESLVTTTKFCGSCHSRKCRCAFDRLTNQTFDVTIEQLAMSLFMETSMIIRVPLDRRFQYLKSRSDVIPRADTSQEFLFRYYMPTNMPTIIIVFMPLNHVKLESTVAAARIYVRYFRDIIQHYIPKTTKIIYIPQFAEFESAKLQHYANATYDNKTATEFIHDLNQEIYLINEADFLHSRALGFFDLLQLSMDKEEWTEDGIHMKTIWYTTVVDMLFNMICTSGKMQEF